jgi:hypothetical protein
MKSRQTAEGPSVYKWIAIKPIPVVERNRQELVAIRVIAVSSMAQE